MFDVTIPSVKKQTELDIKILRSVDKIEGRRRLNGLDLSSVWSWSLEGVRCTSQVNRLLKWGWLVASFQSADGTPFGTSVASVGLTPAGKYRLRRIGVASQTEQLEALRRRVSANPYLFHV